MRQLMDTPSQSRAAEVYLVNTCMCNRTSKLHSSTANGGLASLAISGHPQAARFRTIHYTDQVLSLSWSVIASCKTFANHVPLKGFDEDHFYLLANITYKYSALSTGDSE